jgi:hypothetical protein
MQRSYLALILPNQVTYLKGSLMESFTLGPTPKIDFSSAQQQHLTTTFRENALAQ